MAHLYPINLNIQDALCVVVGGGPVGERKVLGLLAAQAVIRVVSPTVSSALAELADQGRIEWWQHEYTCADITGALLVFAATDSDVIQRRILEDAVKEGALVNLARLPQGSDFHVPSLVRRGDLLLTVSTTGVSPALSAAIRNELALSYGEEYATLVDILGTVRQKLQGLPLPESEKKILFHKILWNDIVKWIRSDNWDIVARHIEDVLGPQISVECASWAEKKA